MAKKHNAPEKPALEPKEALFQAVSLCRKAGALTMGFDAVEEAVVKGKAWLVIRSYPPHFESLRTPSAGQSRAWRGCGR